MKIKRFNAPTTRIALDQIREEQGPDAVILSSQKTDTGVEVVTAIDYDEALLRQMKGRAAKESRISDVAAPLPSAKELNAEALLSKADPQAESEYNSLRSEFGSLRSLVQSQISQMSWTSLSQERPEHAALVKSLTSIGLSGDIVAALAKDLEAINDPANAWREALVQFAKRIPLCATDRVATGGRFALVGTTGVGKTTTIAKLASKFVLNNGSADIALVSYESQAMASPEQLLRTGNILGVPVQKAQGLADLRDTLSQLDSKKLVLIDTPGRSPREEGFDDLLAGLIDPANKIKTLLALSGNAQEGFQRETVNRYKHIDLEGITITKLDETTNLGPLLSLLIREQLKIAYVTEGQQLDTGIRSANGYRAGLASRAVSLAREFRSSIESRPEAVSSETVPLMARA